MRIAAEHPVFAGHFPNKPIVPAVMILSQVISEAAKRGFPVGQVLNAKFVSSIGPDEAFDIVFEEKKNGMGFRVQCNALDMATGLLGRG